MIVYGTESEAARVARVAGVGRRRGPAGGCFHCAGAPRGSTARVHCTRGRDFRRHSPVNRVIFLLEIDARRLAKQIYDNLTYGDGKKQDLVS